MRTLDPPHSEEGEGPGESSISGRILTPTELTRLIRSHLERAFSDFWIEGEVGSLRAPGSGHIYFNLKDPSSQIKTVIFRSHGRFLRFTPKEGQWVLIRGHLSLYEARGEYELIVDYVEPKGAGALQAAFEALKERLSAEGLFDSSRKRPLPRLPGKIGIVTSPAGAALRDILKILRRRFFGLSILIAPVQVQGAGAPGEIARAIDELGERRDLDLLIVTRGGGSLEDLFAFNEEVVARAIARCSVPVISAVGHETDYTIADFVADLRAPTPSAAAEMAVPVREELMEGIHRFAAQLSLLVRHRLDDDRRRLEAECRLLQAPEQQVAHHLRRVDDLSERIVHLIRRILREEWRSFDQISHHIRHLNPRTQIGRLRERFKAYDRILSKGLAGIEVNRARLQRAAAELSALSPLAILSRGYSIVRKIPGGEIVREASTLSRNELLRLHFHRGEADCRVEEVFPPSRNE